MYVWPSPSTPRRRRRSPRRVRVSVRPPAQSVGNAAPVPLAGIVRFAHPSLTPLSPARLSSDLLRLEATVAGSLPALELRRVPTAAPKYGLNPKGSYSEKTPKTPLHNTIYGSK
jgi:hypothetical protein